MVIYDLVCPLKHQFEGWFRSESDYHEQHDNGLLTCPFCESSEIRKIPSASYINTGKGRAKSSAIEPSVDTTNNASKEVQASINPALLEKIRQYVETQTEDVGREFAEEAKKMHYGEKEQRNIRGEVSVEEIVELHEEGIEAVPLPFAPNRSKKLN